MRKIGNFLDASDAGVTSFYPVIPIMKIGLETEMKNVYQGDYCQGRRVLRARGLNMGLVGLLQQFVFLY